MAKRYAFDEYDVNDFGSYVVERVLKDKPEKGVRIDYLFTHWLRNKKGAEGSAKNNFMKNLCSTDSENDEGNMLIDSLQGKEELKKIDPRLFKKLKIQERVTIILKYEFGFTYTEIARVLGVSKTMVAYFYTSDAKNKIKSLIKDESKI